jgi:hypothetical protein
MRRLFRECVKYCSFNEQAKQSISENGSDSTFCDCALIAAIAAGNLHDYLCQLL